MKIRTKLAALALAAGTVVGGGAALAGAGTATAKPIDPAKLPTGPVVTLPVKDICKIVPELCKPKPPGNNPGDPTTTSTTAKPTTTSSTKPDSPKPTTKPTDPKTNDTHTSNTDAPVMARPSFTG